MEQKKSLKSDNNKQEVNKPREQRPKQTAQETPQKGLEEIVKNFQSEKQ